MNRISTFRIITVLLLFLLTGLTAHNVRGTRPVSIIKPLRLFPRQIGDWKFMGNRTSSTEVVKILGVDDYLDYSYVNSHGNRVDLYVGFYETVGGGKGYHSPKHCLPGGGWGIDQVKQVSLCTSKAGFRPVVSEMIIREGAEYQVVYYWFQNRGRIIASEYWEKIYLVLDALTKKRRDGAFVRIMAPVQDGDVATAESLVRQFASDVVVELARFLPGSRLQDGSLSSHDSEERSGGRL